MIGAGDTALTVWNIARWPVVLVFVVFMAGLIATPVGILSLSRRPTFGIN